MVWMKRALIIAAGALTVGGGVTLLLRSSNRPPDGPVEVAWDRDVCAECRMHVGDPRFAAQLHASDGDVHVFDDPGCLVRFLERNDIDVHAVYYHHVQEERWVAARKASFIEVDHSPMGYGFGAVDEGAVGGMDAEEAMARATVRAASPKANGRP